MQRSTVVHNGCRLSYEVDGAGPRVLFIQGTGVHGAAWRPQIDVLRDEYTCLSFDNRGMGQSQPRGAVVTVTQMADDALRIMDELQWESAHVVGHSLGGAIAIELALKQSARVRSLSLLCAFSRGRDAMKLSASMLWTGMRTRIGTKRQRRKAFLELMMTPAEMAGSDSDTIAAELEPVFGHDLADQPSIAMVQLRALGAYDATPRLGELHSIPTLVASAEFDRISPVWVGQGIAKGIPGARYEQFRGAAHGVPLLQATAVNTMLRTHFRRVDGAAQ